MGWDKYRGGDLPAKEKLPFKEEELPFLRTQSHMRIQKAVEGFCAFR
jgi:hypothetical protein